MSLDKNIILHVGLTKTGTTFLQYNVFPFLKDVYHTGFGEYQKFLNQTPIGQLFLDIQNVRLYKIFPKERIEFYKKQINEYLNNIKEKTVLISCENFVGFLGIHRVSKDKPHFDNLRFTNILKEIFPQAKIFFVYRNQNGWMESSYNQCVIKTGSNISFDEYIGYKNDKFIQGNYLDFEKVKWDKIIENYRKEFGENNVLALPYEFFKEDYRTFLDLFFDFTNIEPYYPENNEYINLRKKENTGINYPLLNKYLDWIEYLPKGIIKRKIQKNDRGLRKLLSLKKDEVVYDKIKFDDSQRQELSKILRESNRKLAEITGYDLSKYGYY